MVGGERIAGRIGCWCMMGGGEGKGWVLVYSGRRREKDVTAGIGGIWEWGVISERG